MNGDAAGAIAALHADASRLQATLAKLVSVAGVSARAFPAEEVKRSARTVAKTLELTAFRAGAAA